MHSQRLVKKAQDLYCLGNLPGAEKLLSDGLKRKPKTAWFTTYAHAYLWLGVICRRRGKLPEAMRIYLDMINTESTDQLVRINAMTEMANCCRDMQDFDNAQHWFERIEGLLDMSKAPAGQNIELDKVIVHYLGNRGMLEFSQCRYSDAIESLGCSLDHNIAVNAVEEDPKPFITIYLNLYNCHLALGNIELAKEYLLLARAKMLSLKVPYAHGLIQFFENLATFNLFATGSSHKAIESLMQISEEVVTEFAEFRKVFDFFSSIIVQLHEGKIDVEEVRVRIKEYGDDPLIKAYIPTLLYGAPPPGSDNGVNDIPSAWLKD